MGSRNPFTAPGVMPRGCAKRGGTASGSGGARGSERSPLGAKRCAPRHGPRCAWRRRRVTGRGRHGDRDERGRAQEGASWGRHSRGRPPRWPSCGRSARRPGERGWSGPLSPSAGGLRRGCSITPRRSGSLRRSRPVRSGSTSACGAASGGFRPRAGAPDRARPQDERASRALRSPGGSSPRGRCCKPPLARGRREVAEGRGPGRHAAAGALGPRRGRASGRPWSGRPEAGREVGRRGPSDAGGGVATHRYRVPGRLRGRDVTVPLAQSPGRVWDGTLAGTA
jgi:hypothetical protein